MVINNNKKNNIFSFNFNYLDFINLEESIFTSKKTKELIEENKCDSSYRNSIIKLKNNNYLLSIVICVGLPPFRHHEIFLRIFNFKSNKIDGYNNVISNFPKTVGYSNATSCFQTEKGYIECSFCSVFPINGFTIGIYDLNFIEYNTELISYVEDYTFNKIFHLKKEIGIYIYFDKYTNVPNIQIKKLNVNIFYNLVSLFEFDSIPINGNGTFKLNNGLFYSDANKINDSKFVVVLTSQDLSNLLICIFDLFNNDKSLRITYYYLQLSQINIKISVNIHSFRFINFFGILFYNKNLEYPGYTIFGYPKLISDNKISNNEIEIKLFIDSFSYYFNISGQIELLNNIFEEEIIGIRIINFPNISISGVHLNSSLMNKEIYINDELGVNDQIIFGPTIKGAFPGKYILEFSPIILEPNNEKIKSLADKIKFYGNTDSNYYKPKTHLGNIFKLIYLVECYEKCKTCNQLGLDSFHYCVQCLDEFPYYFYNGEKCENFCNNYIYINENEKKICIENCYDNQFIFIKNENEKYCLSSCFYDNKQLYLDEDNNICYRNCSEALNENIYTYQNKCVSQCPEKYIINLNNECILKEYEDQPSDKEIISNNQINFNVDNLSNNNTNDVTLISSTYTYNNININNESLIL